MLIISPTAELVHYTAALAKDLAKFTAITIGHATREDEPGLPLTEHLVITNCGTALHFKRESCLDLSQIGCVIMDEVRRILRPF